MARTVNSAQISLLTVLLLAGSGSGAAAEAPDRPGKLELSAGLSYNNNVALLSANPLRDALVDLGVKLDLDAQKRRLAYELKGELRHLAYFRQSFNEPAQGRMDGTVKLALLEDRLYWVVEDSLGEAVVDPLAAFSPGNREWINFAATGPELKLRLGDLAFLRAGARYAHVDYQKSRYDSKRRSVDVAAGRELSERSNIAVVGETERLEFLDQGVAPYDRHKTYLKYELEARRTRLRLAAGDSRTSGPEGIAVPFIQAEVTRRMSSALTLELLGGQFASDGAERFRLRSIGATSLPGALFASFNTLSFRARYANVQLSYLRHRSEFAVSVRHERDEYPPGSTVQFDSRYSNAQLRIARRMTERLKSEIYLRTDYTDFPGLGYADHNHGGGTALEYAVNPRWRTRVEFDLMRRTSDFPQLTANQYVLRLSATYTPF